MLPSKVTFFEFIRYGIVGCSSAIVYFFTSILLHFWGFPSYTAIAIAWLVSAIVSYLGFIRFTYKVEPKHKCMLARFPIMLCCSFVISQLIGYIGQKHSNLPFWIISLSIVVIIPCFNYPLGKFYVFKKK